MKKTLIVTLLVVFGSMLGAGAILSKTKSGETAVKKEVKKTATTKSAKQTKAKSSATTKSSSTSTTTKTNEKEPVKQSGSSTVTTPINQIEVIQNITDPEVGLSGLQTGEQINWQAITSGGGFSSSLNFGMLSAVGQPAVGLSSSTNFSLNSGFVQSFGGCCANAGDANNDTRTNIADVTFLIARIFAGGLAPPCCEQGDANGDGRVNIADVTFLIARIFAGGAPPVCGPVGMSC